MFVYLKSKYNPAKNKSNLSYARVCLSFLAKCLFFYLEYVSSFVFNSFCLSVICLFGSLFIRLNLSVYSSQSV